MTLTLNIDDELMERARKFAERRGISLEQMIGDYVQEIALEPSTMSPEEIIEKLEHLWATSGGHSGGRKWTREEIHERKDVP